MFFISIFHHSKLPYSSNHSGSWSRFLFNQKVQIFPELSGRCWLPFSYSCLFVKKYTSKDLYILGGDTLYSWDFFYQDMKNATFHSLLLSREAPRDVSRSLQISDTLLPIQIMWQWPQFLIIIRNNSLLQQQHSSYLLFHFTFSKNIPVSNVESVTLQEIRISNSVETKVVCRKKKDIFCR
jgi:hypothetical protein